MNENGEHSKIGEDKKQEDNLLTEDESESESDKSDGTVMPEVTNKDDLPSADSQEDNCS